MGRKAKSDASANGANGAGPGHNSRELTAEERKALFFHHFRKIADQKAKVDAERAEFNRLRRVAKADKIILGDIDFALRCAELEDDSIVPAELKRQVEIAAWFALPVEFQADLFGENRPIDDRAEQEGEAAGLKGEDCNPPYDGPTGQRWLKGWHKGQAVLLQHLTSAQDKVDAESDEVKLVKSKGGEDDDDAGDNEDADPFEDGEGPASDDDDERDLRPRHLRNDEATRQQ